MLREGHMLGAAGALFAAWYLAACTNPLACDDSEECFRDQVCRDSTCVSAESSESPTPSDASDTERSSDTPMSGPETLPDGGECAETEQHCDGVDDDCDGTIDEGLDRPCSVQAGVCEGSTKSCVDGSYPEACRADDYGDDFEHDEVTCDGKDNDCDGEIDEGCDEDGDGYCAEGRPVSDPPPTGTCPMGGGDCDDGDDSIHPGADEVCIDGVDDDCDGTADEGCPCSWDPCETNNIDTDECCSPSEHTDCKSNETPDHPLCDSDLCNWYGDEGLGVCLDSVVGEDGECEKPEDFVLNEAGACEDGLDNDCDGYTDAPDDFDCQ